VFFNNTPVFWENKTLVINDYSCLLTILKSPAHSDIFDNELAQLWDTSWHFLKHTSFLLIFVLLLA